MQVAHIVPSYEIPTLPTGNLHLVLSHLYKSSYVYRKYYDIKGKSGDFIILDNSAHELGRGGDIHELHEQALRMKASEVVVPDVLDAWQASYKLTERAIQLFRTLPFPLPYRLMLVPQGRNTTQWKKCLDKVLEMYLKYFSNVPFTLGVTKDADKYEYEVKSVYKLLDTYVYPLKQSLPYMDIHLLGWGRDLYYLSDIAKDMPWVRSIDSAKPCAFAYYGITLPETRPVGDPPKYPRRPTNFFNWHCMPNTFKLCTHNMEVFQKIAGGIV